jgi:RNA polymerase-binding transcription factor DksA
VDDQLMDTLDQELRAEITAIEAALTLLEDGVYGLCAMCGEAIAPARLVAAPTVARCPDSASRALSALAAWTDNPRQRRPSRG